MATSGPRFVVMSLLCPFTRHQRMP